MNPIDAFFLKSGQSLFIQATYSEHFQSVKITFGGRPAKESLEVLSTVLSHKLIDKDEEDPAQMQWKFSVKPPLEVFELAIAIAQQFKQMGWKVKVCFFGAKRVPDEAEEFII